MMIVNFLSQYANRAVGIHPTGEGFGHFGSFVPERPPWSGNHDRDGHVRPLSHRLQPPRIFSSRSAVARDGESHPHDRAAAPSEGNPPNMRPTTDQTMHFCGADGTPN